MQAPVRDRVHGGEGADCASPAFRAAFRAQFRGGRDQQKFWEGVQLKEVSNPKLEPLLWNSVAQIAQQRGQDPMDVSSMCRWRTV